MRAEESWLGSRWVPWEPNIGFVAGGEKSDESARLLNERDHKSDIDRLVVVKNAYLYQVGMGRLEAHTRSDSTHW